MKNTLAALLFLCIITSAHGHLAAVPLHGVSDAFSAAINGEAVAFTPRVNVPPASTKGADDRRAMTDSRDGETLKLAQLQDPIAAPQTSGTTPPINSLNKVMYVDPTSTVTLSTRSIRSSPIVPNLRSSHSCRKLRPRFYDPSGNRRPTPNDSSQQKHAETRWRWSENH